MNTILFVYPSAVTWLAVTVYLWTFVIVGRARQTYQVEAPRTDGPEPFLRRFRVQQNTLEQLALFLPSLWLFTVYISPQWAGLLGLVWVLARVFYALAYYRQPEARGTGFIIAFFATIILWLGSAYGIIRTFLVVMEIQFGGPTGSL